MRAKVDYLNAALQDAVTVRLPKDASDNSTIDSLATNDLANETLRQYDLRSCVLTRIKLFETLYL
jgi:hypothetical protein